MRPSELVRIWVDAFNCADADALADLYAEGAVNHQVAESPVCGREAIRKMFADGFASATMVCLVENLFEDGEWAILEWRDPLGLRGCGFFHVVDGKIFFQRGYWDKLSFLRSHVSPPGDAAQSASGSGPTYSLRFDRVIDAPRSSVFQSWVEPAQLTAWYRPDSGWSTTFADVDLRAGGAHRVGLKPPNGEEFVQVGRYLEVVPEERLVYTLQFQGVHLHDVTGEAMERYETVIAVEFESPSPETTRVSVVHHGYRSLEDRERHRTGWPRFLDGLAAYCATASERRFR